MLLPCDLRDWLPPDPLVHVILEAVLADRGFYSEAAVAAVEQRPEGASAGERMRHRLQTQVGPELYQLRKQTVEPGLGIIKAVMGFRRFRLRGRPKVSLEWVLGCLSYNLKRRFVLQHQAVRG
jgi:hypothetical protein